MKDNTAEKNQVIPFGKYKGQPVEMLLADQQYRDWLMAQPWFNAGKYQNIYNTIINYGSEPSDTPEHNAMQAKFLDDVLCRKIVHILYPQVLSSENRLSSSFAHLAKYTITRHRYGSNPSSWEEKIEEYRMGKQPEVMSREYYEEYRYHEVSKNIMRSEIIDKTKYDALMEFSYTGKAVSLSRKFEQNGWDVTIDSEMVHTWHMNGDLDSSRIALWGGCAKIGIELKPSIGDDYPTVLRQILKRVPQNSGDSRPRMSKYVMIAEKFNGVGATLEQIRKMFFESGVNVLMTSEIDQAELYESCLLGDVKMPNQSDYCYKYFSG